MSLSFIPLEERSIASNHALSLATITTLVHICPSIEKSRNNSAGISHWLPRFVKRSNAEFAYSCIHS